MTELAYFMLLGLGVGAIYGGLSLGLVIVYKGSGVINFGQAAMAAYAAYTYYGLVEHGQLIVPPIPNPIAPIAGTWNLLTGNDVGYPGLPSFIEFGESVQWWMAASISILLSALLGLVLHYLVFRPLRHAPVLAKVVASVGITLAIEAILGIRYGDESRTVRTILPSNDIVFFGSKIGLDRLILAILVVLMGLVLSLIFRYSRFGLRITASAESEVAASLVGIRAGTLTAATWVIASAITGLVGILAAPITTLSPSNFTLFIVPALAVAVLARFSSPMTAVIAGLVMGMVDQTLILIASKPAFEWLPNGTRTFIPFAVVLIAIALRGSALPSRGESVTVRMPRVPQVQARVRPIAIILVVNVVAMFTAPYEIRNAVIMSTIGAGLCISLVILTGLLGQISLAQMTLAGVAGFLLTVLSDSLGIPFPVAPLLASLLAALLGVAVGLPSVRTRGVALAITTLALAYTVQTMIFGNNEIVRQTGDVARASRPQLFGIGFGPFDGLPGSPEGTPGGAFGVFVAIVVSILALFLLNLRRSLGGGQMLAIRSNERAAAAMGINVQLTKLMGFGISAFVAGLSGCLLVYRNAGGLDPHAFAALVSLSVLASAYLGGITSLGGAFFGGCLISGGLGSFLTHKLFGVDAYTGLIAGVGLILTAILNPEGIAGVFRPIYSRVSGGVRMASPPVQRANPVESQQPKSPSEAR